MFPRAVRILELGQEPKKRGQGGLQKGANRDSNKVSLKEEAKRIYGTSDER